MLTDTDQAFLEQLGIQVVQHPCAWEMMRKDTFVFAKGLPWWTTEPSVFYGRKLPSDLDASTWLEIPDFFINKSRVTSTDISRAKCTPEGPAVVLGTDVRSRPPISFKEMFWHGELWKGEVRRRNSVLNRYEAFVLANFEEMPSPVWKRAPGHEYKFYPDQENPKGLHDALHANIYIRKDGSAENRP